MTVIATAGHVDHGKSTLVEALTGTDPDRWAEEKERGLTIDLGFALCRLPSGTEISFVDVPGHVRFLRNMLAGVGAVQGCVFVVSAVEGWKPQSEEHLRILDLLGIPNGIVALTMADLVDDELLELAELEIEEHVEGTFLEGAPIIAVSAITGLGMPALQQALDNLSDTLGPAANRGRPRLWVDRSFAPAGAGTVVTGTLVDGEIAVGDELEVSSTGRTARVRSLQRHHEKVDRTDPGTRLAVNLTGVAHHDVGRGDVLIASGQWHHTSIIDAELRALPSLAHEVSRRGAYTAYIGSGEFPVKIRILGEVELTAGNAGFIRLYLQRPIPALPGDRFILRESGRGETIGGGHFIDIDPQTTATRANPTTDLTQIIDQRGWIEADRLSRITGTVVEPTLGSWVVSEAALSETSDRVRTTIEEAGSLGLDIALLSEQERATLPRFDDIVVEAGMATLGEAPDPLADHPWLAALAAAPFSPPGPDGVDRAEIRQMVRRGTVVERDKVFFAATAMQLAAQLVSNQLAKQPEGLTVAEVRDLLGTSRKFVLPILNELDSTGMTRRRDDFRIGGPRLPEPE